MPKPRAWRFGALTATCVSVGILASAAVGPTPATAQETLNVTSFGGALQAAQKKVFMDVCFYKFLCTFRIIVSFKRLTHHSNTHTHTPLQFSKAVPILGKYEYQPFLYEHEASEEFLHAVSSLHTSD